jgi:DUF1365 family protein
LWHSASTIYLHDELSSQWPLTESARIQTTATATRKRRTNETEQNWLRLFIYKHEFLNISVDLQIAFAAETRCGEGRCLEKQQSIIRVLTMVHNTLNGKVTYIPCRKTTTATTTKKQLSWMI